MCVLSMCFPQILYTSHEAIKRKLIDNQIPLGRDRERGSMYILHIPSQSIIYPSIYRSIYLSIYLYIYIYVYMYICIYVYMYICIYVPLFFFGIATLKAID